ncbi:MAG: ATP-binding cassette domain-containing protein [Acidobacteria bacterium]|nr:ATP-binding cassette domain-containing protein [Acidobacteriota bacterium]
MGKTAAIEVKGVTKRYRRVAQSHKFLTLKSAFVGGNLFKLLNPSDVFTALEDVDLEIGRGETFGLIGANGAGKSTLMKLVAGTTKPTEGTVQLNGKISALIELGAGFHPEISGRENVYINGIMLGLTREEIEARFDDIVAFAELEEFIDAPVKNYSSGMYMRLGFSVAIHVDPDILVIDEVLAVGDEAFVHKCLDKIGEFKRRGKTILLVTHGMETVRRLCDRAAWIDHGKVKAVGDPMRVVDRYLNWVGEQEEAELTRVEKKRVEQAGEGSDTKEEVEIATEAPTGPEGEEAPYEPGRWGNQAVRIEGVRFLDEEGHAGHVFATGDAMTMEIAWSAETAVKDFAFGIGLFNANGVSCYGTNTDVERFKAGSLEGEGAVQIQIPSLDLVIGTYYLDVAVHSRDGRPYDYHRGLYSFRVHSRYGDVGVARLAHTWGFRGGVSWKQLGGIDCERDPDLVRGD